MCHPLFVLRRGILGGTLALTLAGCRPAAPVTPSVKPTPSTTPTRAAALNKPVRSGVPSPDASGDPNVAAAGEGGELKAGSVPPLLDPNDVYAADRANLLSPVVRDFPSRVYVPNSDGDTVDVIDAQSYEIIDHFAVGRQPQHVVPSWDMKTLWIANDRGNTLTPIDPATGIHGASVPVDDPYNLYFTPDGRYAIAVCERLHRLDFRDAHTMRLVHSLNVPGKGVDHMDFSKDGAYLIASDEFSGDMVKVDVQKQKVIGTVNLRTGDVFRAHVPAMDMRAPGMRLRVHNMPQDVKLSPDGSVFYVADMMADGLWIMDGDSLKIIGYVATGGGAHGLYASRDSKSLYVSNRHEGTVSVVSFATRKPVAKWRIPHGGSPDMGGVSADGKTLWLSGRYNREVYAFNTDTGQLRARIKVGKGPHGLCVYPQPGRYSLGHTGVFR